MIFFNNTITNYQAYKSNICNWVKSVYNDKTKEKINYMACKEAVTIALLIRLCNK